MIFFVAMPIMFGLINLIMPLQIGAPDVALQSNGCRAGRTARQERADAQHGERRHQHRDAGACSRRNHGQAHRPLH